MRDRAGFEMSVHVVKVPDIGEGIAEVEVVEWYVQPGDTIPVDQTVCDLMTDKATVEVPSPISGRVVSLGGKVGDKLAVGAELIRLETDEASAVGAGKAAAAAPAAAATSAPSTVAAAKPAAAPPKPAATRSATSETAPAGPPQGRGPLGGDERSEFRGDFVTPTSVDKPLASPSVRRHARELQIDLPRVRGSGPGGRIVHDDLMRHAEGAGARPERAPRYAERSGQHDVAVIGLRRQIALRMRESLRIPHFTYVEEIDVTELEALRAQLNDEHGKERGRLTVLPFLMRAIVLAMPSFPQMNARFDDEKGIVTRYGAVHIGVAAQTQGGLMVPVVRHAEARDLWSSAAEVTRLAEAARSGKATRDELSGSTITITSLGPLGGIVTTPVINIPEVAIVGVNRIVERPMIRSGAIVPRKMMNLSSSFDHRVVDGQQAAEFVQALRRYLEYPALLFVD
jgi:2-oxoisovalerate dehydrogenase E2 component (dihydrolipoyl transacylase)